MKCKDLMSIIGYLADGAEKPIRVKVKTPSGRFGLYHIKGYETYSDMVVLDIDVDAEFATTKEK